MSFTVFITQQPATQDIIMASPAKTKTVKKKPPARSLPTKSPGKKDGDIRALFSTATKSTKSYTRLINDLGIQNNQGIPTQLINLLVDLNLDNSIAKICYICQSICDCNLITKIRNQTRKPTVLPRFLTEPKFPNLDLLDDIDAESILNYAKNDNTLEVSRQESSTGIDQNCSGNFDLELDFCSPEIFIPHSKFEKTPVKDNVSKENLAESNKNFELELDFQSLDATSKHLSKETLETNFEIGDIEDIFAESSPEVNIQKDLVEILDEEPETKPNKADNNGKNEDALDFFGLDSIDDIFADDDSIDKPTAKESTEAKGANKEIAPNNNDKSDTVLNSDYPRSPSILSGRQKVANTEPTSPILCSQVRKFQLSIKKNRPHSTPISNSISAHNDLSKSHNCTSDTTNKSMFTITQLVHLINKTDDGNSVLHNSDMKKEDNDVIEQIERSNSPILLTQADKKKSLNVSSRSKPCIPPKKSDSLIILDSDSSDSNDDTQIYEVDDKIITTHENNNVKNATLDTFNASSSKRKLDFGDDDFHSLSPYFNKKQKLDNQGSKKLTLQEKVLAALSSNKVFNSPKNNNSDVNFVSSPVKFFSQKENLNPDNNTSKATFSDPDDEKEFIRKSNLEMLQMFRRDSAIKSPKMNIFWKDNKLDQKRKLSFDSDDDFVCDDKFPRSPRPVNAHVANKSTTNHKVRKVSSLPIHYSYVTQT